MEINLEACREIAVKHGLPLQFVIKEYHLFDVLSQIASFAVPQREKLVFKGGTALSKVYLQKAQRFSEDLDFDLDASPEKIKKFSQRLAQNLPGYSISEFRKVRETIQFYCVYDSPLGQKDHIRVDIASKQILTAKLLVIKPAVSEFVQSMVIGFLVYEMEDLAARKLNALCSRTEGKDVFDVYSALPLCNRMGEALKQMLKSEGRKETPLEFLARVMAVVKKADAKKLRNLTNPFIPLEYRPKDWEELKNELLRRLEQIEL